MVERISTGFQPLDEILGGGIDSETLTEVYGEAGSGKSNLAMMLMRSAVQGGRKAVFIDTEGMSFERLEQICGSDFDWMIEEMMIRQVYSLEDQEKAVIKAIDAVKRTGKIGIIVVDSITGLYRAELGSEGKQHIMRSLTNQLLSLLTVAREHEVAVLVTNQVYTDRQSGEYRPLGGRAMEHYAKTILRLDRLHDGRRRAIVVKHRSVQEGLYAEFRIGEDGFEPVDKRYSQKND